MTDVGLIALKGEWVRTFGNWCVTPESVDMAIEFCKAEWTRMPENVTKAFREMLDKAMAKINERLGTGIPESQQRGYREFDGLIDAGAKISVKLKQKYPEADWMKDVPAMLNALRKTAKENNPEASDLDIFRIVWGMV